MKKMLMSLLQECYYETNIKHNHFHIKDLKYNYIIELWFSLVFYDYFILDDEEVVGYLL